MESSILDLIKPINTLNGINEKTLDKLTNIGIKRVIDLLFYFPTNIIKRNFCSIVKELRIKECCVIKLKVISYLKTPRITKVICQDIAHNEVILMFFKMYPNYLDRYLPLNKEVVVVGNPEIYKQDIVFNHPKIVQPELAKNLKTIDAEYRKHQHITSEKFHNYIQQSLRILESCDIPEWLNERLLNDKFTSFKTSLLNIHNPQSQQDIDISYNNITRIAIDEMIAYHLSLLQSRQQKQENSIVIIPNNKLNKILLQHLPFKLTEDQISAIKGIKKTLANANKSSILLQGDVGSGKTIVSFISALFAIESGYQVAFMAPTEILATQHYNNFVYYADKLNIKVTLLKGKEKPKIKQQILKDLNNHAINLVVGTHALFQENVKFCKLGLIIVDEQHRFGVEQRVKLSLKGNNPNIILATATPIPRTLALSLYGDIETYDIKTKPNNKKEIITRTVNINRFQEVVSSVKNALLNKEKIYWVCHLVEDSEKVDLTSVTNRYNHLKQEFGGMDYKIFLIHGKMSSDDKNSIINAFQETSGALLISTTVIEVGIDIPECNIMIIEDADRFGLAQLHQLRGRVGRGSIEGRCILLYSQNISKIAKERLSILKNTNDGFYIAQKDLELRGFGDVLGINQSGFEYLKITNLNIHHKYFVPSMEYAKYLFTMAEQNKNIKQKVNYLLKIFDKTAVNYLKQG